MALSSFYFTSPIIIISNNTYIAMSGAYVWLGSIHMPVVKNPSEISLDTAGQLDEERRKNI
jgi:hypothetical protein